jgi:hypothetical protein
MMPILMRCSGGTRCVSFNRVVVLKAWRQSSNSGSLRLRARSKFFSEMAFATS